MPRRTDSRAQERSATLFRSCRCLNIGFGVRPCPPRLLQCTRPDAPAPTGDNAGGIGEGAAESFIPGDGGTVDSFSVVFVVESSSEKLSPEAGLPHPSPMLKSASERGLSLAA